jgi:predicted RNase H-related nuclease YkuK (DUF458 family)
MREQAIANKKVQESLSTKLEKEREKFSLEAAKAGSNLLRSKKSNSMRNIEVHIDFESNTMCACKWLE